ncbi:MAG: GHKL domain-containing protein [Oscillospiraceae bacterium]|nr:GHKL domain-containing protein [Oscillospiraceae bacterium]
MIYSVFECIATISECIILYIFLIMALQYRVFSEARKVVVTSFFLIVSLVNAIIFDNLNHLFNLEYIYMISYIAILFIFARVALQGKWWHQCSLILISIILVFIINLIITICSGIILKDNYSALLLMRNPTRVFLLVVSKVSLAVFLFFVCNIVRSKKMILHTAQCVVAIFVFVFSVIIGVTIEKMLLDNIVPMKYATIIMISLSIIIILILFIFMQFSKINQFELNRISLQTRLYDDGEKYIELARWNKSIRTIRHDMNNHLIAIKQLIYEHKYQNTLEYIKKIEDNISDIPHMINSNNSVLNAILDVKRMICHNEHIDLKCYIQNDLPDFDDFAFSTILGNLIDNATEAERKEEQKEIRLAIESDGNNIRITIQNKIHKPVLRNGQLPETSKKDRQNHGLGMASIFETISRNDGAIDFYEQDGWLIVDVLLPVR